MTSLVQELRSVKIIGCDWSLYLILDLGRDGVGETAKTAVPRANVEAGADLGKDVLEGIGYSLKIALLKSNFGSVLVSQIVDLFLEYQGFLQKIDEGVKSLGHSDEVGTEFWSVLALDLELLEEVSRLGVLVGQLVEDRCHDLDLTVSV